MKYAEITGKVIGCAIEVHNEIGCGFQEVIYQRALQLEMGYQGIVFEREFEMPIKYKGEPIGARRVDFLVDGNISVELKAVSKLEDIHMNQAKNYLEAYNLAIGLLINFGEPKLNFKRIYNNHFKPEG